MEPIMKKSKNWKPGTAGRPWARVRALVLARDGYRCQLQLPGCLEHAPPRAVGGVPAGHAHHTRPRSTVGDNPDYMIAACAPCNIRAGDPAKQDPKPTLLTEW